MVWLALIGCGILQSDRPLNELDDDGRAALCEKHFTLTLPIGQECVNGYFLDFPGQSIDECIERWVPLSCEATEQEWIACMETLDNNACPLAGGQFVSSCLTLSNCYQDGLLEPSGVAPDN